jgi:DNA (cytosine-5)-methyltransferase 1
MRRVLDLGCGEGIVAEAYRRAGFYVTGVDIAPQPRYRGHEFILADMLTFPLDGYDFIHASPPCQRWSKMTRCRPGLAAEYPDLITPMVPRLEAIGIPAVLENVDGTLDDPDVGPLMSGATVLCSYSFGRDLYRHRVWRGFNGFAVPPLAHRRHGLPASKAGHWVPGTVMSIAGHIAPVALARELMGVDWFVPREELVEAVPVYMTSYVAYNAMAAISRLEVA